MGWILGNRGWPFDDVGAIDAIPESAHPKRWLKHENKTNTVCTVDYLNFARRHHNRRLLTQKSIAYTLSSYSTKATRIPAEQPENTSVEKVGACFFQHLSSGAASRTEQMDSKELHYSCTTGRRPAMHNIS